MPDNGSAWCRRECRRNRKCKRRNRRVAVPGRTRFAFELSRGGNWRVNGYPAIETSCVLTNYDGEVKSMGSLGDKNRNARAAGAVPGVRMVCSAKTSRTRSPSRSSLPWLSSQRCLACSALRWCSRVPGRPSHRRHKRHSFRCRNRLQRVSLCQPGACP